MKVISRAIFFVDLLYPNFDKFIHFPNLYHNLGWKGQQLSKFVPIRWQIDLQHVACSTCKFERAYQSKTNYHPRSLIRCISTFLTMSLTLVPCLFGSHINNNIDELYCDPRRHMFTNFLLVSRTFFHAIVDDLINESYWCVSLSSELFVWTVACFVPSSWLSLSVIRKISNTLQCLENGWCSKC